MNKRTLIIVLAAVAILAGLFVGLHEPVGRAIGRAGHGQTSESAR